MFSASDSHRLATRRSLVRVPLWQGRSFSYGPSLNLSIRGKHGKKPCSNCPDKLFFLSVTYMRQKKDLLAKAI